MEHLCYFKESWTDDRKKIEESQKRFDSIQKEIKSLFYILDDCNIQYSKNWNSMGQDIIEIEFYEMDSAEKIEEMCEFTSHLIELCHKLDYKIKLLSTNRSDKKYDKGSKVSFDELERVRSIDIYLDDKYDWIYESLNNNLSIEEMESEIKGLSYILNDDDMEEELRMSSIIFPRYDEEVLRLDFTIPGDVVTRKQKIFKHLAISQNFKEFIDRIQELCDDNDYDMTMWYRHQGNYIPFKNPRRESHEGILTNFLIITKK